MNRNRDVNRIGALALLAVMLISRAAAAQDLNLRAYIVAMAVIRRDKETTVKSMGKFLKTSDHDALESTCEEYKNVFPVTPLMTAAEVQAVLDVAKSPKAKIMKPQEFFDNSMVQKIHASGFIEQVNKR